MAADFELEVDGVAEVIRELDRMGRLGRLAFEEITKDEWYKVEAAAVEQTPLDTGLLRSAREVVVQRRTGGVHGRIEWSTERHGDTGLARTTTGTEYARYVHDNLDVNHPTGKARFLQDPFEAAARDWDARVARRLRARLKI